MSALMNAFEESMAGRETSVARDLKLNFKRAMTDGPLAGEEAALAALALTRATGLRQLEAAAKEAALEIGLSSEVVDEAIESAAIMGMLNVYYRFRHFIGNSAAHDGGAAPLDYGAAKLRMQSLAAPLMGKERFELLAIGVSIVNGCEKCVTSHEKALLQLGVAQEKIHEIARLAATIKGLSVLLGN